MQYILSQEEYDEFIRIKAELKRLPTVQYLQDFCTYVANSIPMKRKYSDPTPWICVLSTDEEHYCDGCPCVDICPLEHKGWSK